MRRTSPLHLFWLVFIPLFIGSCVNNDSGNVSSSDISANNLFTPHPVQLPEHEVKTLSPGSPAPDFNLPDIYGKFYTLQDFRNARILVIIFTCNHCPTAQAYENRIIDFTRDYSAKSVTTVAIMPNSVFGLLPEECGYSDLHDTFYEMKVRAENKHFNFPYLYDGDNQSAAISYGPVATPHVFVFDEKRILQYTGRLDNSEKPGTGNAEDLRSAVDALLEGRAPETTKNKAFGCSVKWSWKSDWTNKVNQQWKNREVKLSQLTNEGIPDLLKNDSNELLLINFWATWCTPCITEYPEFVEIQRMYGERAFRFVSVSADPPYNRDKVFEFLQENHSAVDNYMYAGDDKYNLIELVDTSWGGALPYTLLIEPGGNVIYREQGIANLLQLRKIIVEHPLLGRYY